jgi:hypothetical protein
VEPHVESLLGDCAAAVLVDGADRGFELAGRDTCLVFSIAMDSWIASTRLHDPATGALVGSWTVSETTRGLLRQLRREMYRPDLGTWHWLSIKIGAEGEVESRFFYDERPEWEGTDLLLEPSAYRADRELYPSGNAPVPAWLSERLAQPD